MMMASPSLVARQHSATLLNSVHPQPDDDGSLVLKIDIPDLYTQKTICVRQDDVIWPVKMQLINELPQKVLDMFNYGFFLPPYKGKVGKFLLEDRIFKEYAFGNGNALLQLRYKGRLDSIFDGQDRQSKRVNSESYRKKLIRYIRSRNAAKVEDICNQGLDPNFIDQRFGETPLTIAASMCDNRDVLMSLANAGAHLDFRNLTGQTALHKAAVLASSNNVRTLLELRSSPYYKDRVGLTPLYYCVSCENSSSDIAELLLRDYSEIGITDVNGNQEIHTACRNGLAAHLEHLLFYRADPNCRNFNGNTPLHVCASRNQVSCARVLLFRGSDPNIMNNQQQTAYHLALLASSPEIANLLKNYDSAKTVPYRGAPLYNSKRKWRRVRTMAKPPMSSVSEYGEYSCCTDAVTPHNMPPNQGQCDSNVGAMGNGNVKVPGNMTLAVDQRHFLANVMKQALTGKYKFTPYETSLQSPYSSPYQARRETPTPTNHTHTVVVPRGPNGFGFLLAGAQKLDATVQFEPNQKMPSLQYFKSVAANGNALKAGVKSGDFLVELNGIDVRCVSHDEVVKLIEAAGSSLVMKVVTVDSQPAETPHLSYRQTKTVGRCNGPRVLGECHSMIFRTPSLYNFSGNYPGGIADAGMWEANEPAEEEQKVVSIQERPSSKISVQEFEHLVTPNGRCDDARIMTECTKEPRVYGSVSEMKRQRQKPPAKPHRTVSLIKDAKSTPDLHYMLDDSLPQNEIPDPSTDSITWRTNASGSLKRLHSVSRPLFNEISSVGGDSPDGSGLGEFDRFSTMSETAVYSSSQLCSTSKSFTAGPVSLRPVPPPPPPPPLPVVGGATIFCRSSQTNSQNGHQPVIGSLGAGGSHGLPAPPPPIDPRLLKETANFPTYTGSGGRSIPNRYSQEADRTPTTLTSNHPGRNLDFDSDLRNALNRRRNLICSHDGSESVDSASDSKEFSFTSMSTSKAPQKKATADEAPSESDIRRAAGTAKSREHDSMSVASTLSTLSGCSAGSELAAISNNKNYAGNSSSFATRPCCHLNGTPGISMPAVDYEVADSGKGDSDGDERKDNTSGTLAFKNKPVKVWTTDDVCSWLECLHLHQYKDEFAKAEVNGQKLLLFGRTDFTNLGVTRVAHRVLIENSLDSYVTSSKL